MINEEEKPIIMTKKKENEGWNYEIWQYDGGRVIVARYQYDYIDETWWNDEVMTNDTVTIYWREPDRSGLTDDLYDLPENEGSSWCIRQPYSDYWRLFFW